MFQFDDEKNKTDTDTGWMPVPEMVTPDDMHPILTLAQFCQWRNIPGGPLPTASWNQTIEPDPSTSVYILQVPNTL